MQQNILKQLKLVIFNYYSKTKMFIFVVIAIMYVTLCYNNFS